MDLGDRYIDFSPNPNPEIEEEWSPEGYSWYGDKLIPKKPCR